MKIAELFVELSTKGLSQVQSDIDKVGDKSRSTSNAMDSLKATALKLFAALGASIGLKTFIDEAGQAELAMVKLGRVFRENTAEVAEWAEQLSVSLGKQDDDTKAVVTRFQQMLVSMGVNRKEAIELSKAYTKLTFDLSAFAGVDAAESVNTISMALAGAFRGLKQYGIVLKDTDVDQELLSRGLDKATTGVTAYERAQATLNAILQRSGDVLGAAEEHVNTQVGAYEQMKNTAAELAESIGNALLPSVRELTKFVTSILAPMKDWADSHRQLIKDVFLLTVAFGGLLKLGPMLEAMMLGMFAHPVLVATGIIAGLILVLGNLEDRVKDLEPSLGRGSDALEEQQGKYGDLARELYRLMQLQTPTMDQQRRMGEIANELNGKYGEQLFIIDQMTGKVYECGDAFQRLADIMAKQAMDKAKEDVEGLSQALKEQSAQMDALLDEMVNSKFGDNMGAIGRIYRSISGNFDADISKLRANMDETLKKLDQARDRLNALNNKHGPATIPGHDRQAEPAIPIFDEKEVSKLDDLQRDVARDFMDAHQKKLDQIDEEADKRREAAMELIHDQKELQEELKLIELARIKKVEEAEAERAKKEEDAAKKIEDDKKQKAREAQQAAKQQFNATMDKLELEAELLRLQGRQTEAENLEIELWRQKMREQHQGDADALRTIDAIAKRKREGGGDKEKPGFFTSGLADMAMKMQELIFNQKGEETGRRQLNAAEKAARLLENIDTSLKGGVGMKAV